LDLMILEVFSNLWFYDSGTYKDSLLFASSADDSMWIMPTAKKLE